MDLYEQYLDFREKFNGIYGKPTEILDESFEETLEFGKRKHPTPILAV